MRSTNLLRITGGLLIRLWRCGVNELRVARLRAKGLKCSGRVFIYPQARLDRPGNISIGERSVIGKSVLLAAAKIEIGKRTLIGHNVFLCTGSHDIYSDEFAPVRNPIVIGDGVWVADGATVLPGVHIGDNAVVSANAVVFRNVPAGSVAIGNPAKILKVGRSMSSAFNPLALANIDYETSLARLKGWFRGSSMTAANTPKTEETL